MQTTIDPPPTHRRRVPPRSDTAESLVALREGLIDLTGFTAAAVSPHNRHLRRLQLREVLAAAGIPRSTADAAVVWAVHFGPVSTIGDCLMGVCLDGVILLADGTRCRERGVSSCFPFARRRHGGNGGDRGDGGDGEAVWHG